MTKRKIVIIVLLCVVSTMTLFSAMHFAGDDYILNYAQELTVDNVNDGVHFVKSDNTATVFTDDDTLRVLQLSDLHIVGSRLTHSTDRQSVDAIVDIIEATRPDLVVITGDLTYSTPPLGNINNEWAYKTIGTLMEKFNIPWTFTFGNHDDDPFLMHDKKTQAEYYTSLDNCLMYSAAEVDGYGNHVVMFDSNGSHNTALIMLDCLGYDLFPFKYATFSDSQVSWYSKTVTQLNTQSLLFTHVPLKEYDNALKLYKNGEAELLNGTTDKRVASASTSNGLFDEIVKHGSTKAVFCGHDHTNNWAIKYKGVALCYGMSIDCIAYPGIAKKTAQRGGRLIEIDADGTITLSMVPQDNNYQPTDAVTL